VLIELNQAWNLIDVEGRAYFYNLFSNASET
jgi:hypothetical protein